MLILHHPHKGRRHGPPSLEDVSGFREVFSGLGSVLFLDSPRAGDSLITVHHVKPIHEPMPIRRILRDHAAGTSEAAPDGFVVVGADEVAEGRVPVDSIERKALACIDVHPSGEAPAASLKEVLRDDNLARALKDLKTRGVVEQEGRGPQSRYRRGPNAPPRE